MAQSAIGKRYVPGLVLALVATISAFSQQPSTPNPSSPPAPVSATPAAAPNSAPPLSPTDEQQPAVVSSRNSDATGEKKSDTPASITGDNAGNLPQNSSGDTSVVSTGTPSTTAMPETKAVKSIDSLLEPPPMPSGKVSLLGGTVHSIDQIRNRMLVDIFGKGKMKVFFDERSHFYRNGVETTQLAVHKGDRVYVDTQLAQGRIFARNIQVQANTDAAAVSGQIVSFNSMTGALVIHDPLSAQPVSLKLTPASVVTVQGQSGSRNDLLPQSLVTVHFAPQSGRPVKEIEVLARKGAQFPFYGTLTHLDLRAGLLAVENKSDNKVYDIKFEATRIGVTDDLTPGAEVAVVATFDGNEYTAQTVKVTRVASSEKTDKTDKTDKDKEEKDPR